MLTDRRGIERLTAAVVAEEQIVGVGRLQLIRIINGQIRRLDMSRSSVRDRVSHAMSDDDLNYIFDEVGFSN